MNRNKMETWMLFMQFHLQNRVAVAAFWQIICPAALNTNILKHRDLQHNSFFVRHMLSVSILDLLATIRGIAAVLFIFLMAPRWNLKCGEEGLAVNRMLLQHAAALHQQRRSGGGVSARRPISAVTTAPSFHHHEC